MNSSATATDHSADTPPPAAPAVAATTAGSPGTTPSVLATSKPQRAAVVRTPAKGTKAVAKARPSPEGKAAKTPDRSASAKPAVSAKPAASAKPGPTAKPAASARPVGSARPAGSAKPAKTPDRVLSAKPAPAAKPAPSAKPAPTANAPAVKAAAADKPRKAKAKLVRDSFTMPQADFDLIATLKQRALVFQRPAKKSELLRAGLHALLALGDVELRAALDDLTPLKPGRPKRID